MGLIVSTSALILWINKKFRANRKEKAALEKLTDSWQSAEDLNEPLEILDSLFYQGLAKRYTMFEDPKRAIVNGETILRLPKTFYKKTSSGYTPTTLSENA